MEAISCLSTQILDKPSPEEGAVYLWCSHLDRSPQDVQALLLTLSDDERVRADRFCFQVDRTRCIVRRGLLRVILGSYLHIEPSSLCFCYGPQGKPRLALTNHDQELHFNVSHSNNLALLAFSWQRRIGVDIEAMRPVPDLESVSKLVFSTRENVGFHLLPSEQQMEAFFDSWTCKEGYLKATGEGLSQAPSEIELSLLPGGGVRLLSVKGSQQEAKRWYLASFSPARGYKAALVVEGIECRVQHISM